MKLAVFTLRFDPVMGRFDDSELRAFMPTASVVSVEQTFLQHMDAPWLLLVVQYKPVAAMRVGPAAVRPAADEERPESSLDAVERQRFDALRTWRNTRARAQGLQPFLIMTNRQLAEVARTMPRTGTDLVAIEGIGTAKRASFGDDLLKFLEQLDAPAPAAPEAT
jgi:superfamily II DNA helicase RecQ